MFNLVLMWYNVSTMKNWRVFNIVFALSLVAALSFPLSVKAVTVDELNRQIQQKKDAAKNTQGQINSLDSALQRISGSIQSTQQKLQQTSDEIGQIQTEIDKLSGDIEVKKKDLAELKKKLNGLIVEIYRFSSRSQLENLLLSNKLSETANEQDYVAAVQMQVTHIFGQVDSVKTDLEKQKSNQEAKKAELDQLKQNQTGYLSSLGYQQDTSNKLKGNAQGALQDYQQQISRLEAQKRSMEAAQAGIRSGGSMVGGSDLVTGSASWYFSQDDPAWSGSTIGNSDSTIGRYGCALTSLAMVLKYYGVSVTPLSIASNPDYFSNDLIAWPEIGGHGVSSGGGWSKVDDWVSQGRPVVVKLSAFGGTHFVVIKSKMSDGRYEILDPISGNRTYGKDLVMAFYFSY